MKKWLGLAFCVCAALLAACGGGGAGVPSSGSIPTDQPTGDQPPIQSPSAAPTTTALPQEVVMEAGGVDGAPGQFNPARGNTATGGQGQTVDGIPCAPTMAQNAYHIHSYLGVIVNGGWIAVPDSIGMENPGPLVNGFVDAASCFYYIHTHDLSGTIHQESPSATPLSGSLFTVGNLLDIWGEPIGATGFGPFSGMVRVFTATVPLKQQIASSYTEFTGDPKTIKFSSHEAVWIEVGPPFVEANALPPVRFYTEY